MFEAGRKPIQIQLVKKSELALCIQEMLGYLVKITAGRRKRFQYLAVFDLKQGLAVPSFWK